MPCVAACWPETGPPNGLPRLTIACLILGYRGANVLARALPVFDEAGFHVFIHLDAKADRESYRTSLGEPGRRCIFIEEPYDVFWGGYTMVLAELKLLATARAAGPYDKFVLLSDDCFPALPPGALRERLQSAADQVTHVLQPSHSPFYARYHGFYCLDHPTTAAKSVGGLQSGSVDESLEEKIAEIGVLRRRGKKPIDVYFGSQFWALTQDSVDLVLRVVAEDAHLCKSFEYSALPDETMIQSILGNYRSGESQTSGPVYADFAFTQRGAPRLIASEADLPLDLQPCHLFFRKVAPDAINLLDAMSKRLLSGQAIGGGIFRTDAGGSLVTLRLSAPPDNPGPGWHGLESFGGRTYRWTGHEEMVWNFPDLPLPPGRLRFVITIVVGSGTDFLSECRLTFGGETKPLEYVDGVLSAAFDHDAVTSLQVVLRTPPLTSPRETAGHEDDRKLGLSIAT